MKPLLTCAFLLAASSLIAAAETPSTAPAQITPGYRHLIGDLQTRWWNAESKPAHFWPTRGIYSSPTAHNNGTIDPKAAKPSFWQMTQMANVFYWHFQLVHSTSSKKEIASQWAYIRTCFTDEQLAAASTKDGIVNVSDDGSWELNYLCQVHEVTGDSRALADAEKLLANILDRFADPNAPRTDCGALHGSLYGILYDSNHATDKFPNSTSYEITLANSALYLYAQTHRHDYFAYATSVYDWAHKYLKHPERGYYYYRLDLRPSLDGKQNPHYLKPLGNEFGPPTRAHSATSPGGTLAMAVLAIRLYHYIPKADYLEEAKNITDHFVRADAFLRPGKLFVNACDPWTDAYWSPYFANEVLPTSGVDESGLWKQCAHNTALAILASRTPQGDYGADWSGPELDRSDHSMTWIQHVQTPHSEDMALPNQIMTTSNSAAMVTAAEIIETNAHHQPPTDH